MKRLSGLEGGPPRARRPPHAARARTVPNPPAETRETITNDLLTGAASPYLGRCPYTVPVSGLIAARKIARALARGTDGRAIEDLWLPFFCVSANLTRSRLVVHRRGDLALALRASQSIPGIMPPVPAGEDLLVDGGVLNNIPIDVMRRLHPTATVIASDAAPVLGPRARVDYGLYLRGGGVLARRLVPGMQAPRVPRLMATLMRSLLVAAAESRDEMVAEGLADLHLQLELPGVSLLAFDKAAEVEAAAYEEVREQVGAWAAARTGRATPVGASGTG
jgi:predicted acylesterase/phospholipase RssA